MLLLKILSSTSYLYHISHFVETASDIKQVTKGWFYLFLNALPFKWLHKLQFYSILLIFTEQCLGDNSCCTSCFFSLGRRSRFKVKVFSVLFILGPQIQEIYLNCTRSPQRTYQGSFLVNFLMTYKHCQEFISTVLNCLLKSTSLKSLLLFSINLIHYFGFPNIS